MGILPLCSIAFPQGFVPGTAKTKILYSTPVGHTLSPTKKPMKRAQLWSSLGVAEGSDWALILLLSILCRFTLGVKFQQ